MFKDLEFEYDTASVVKHQLNTIDYWTTCLSQFVSLLTSYHPSIGQSCSRFIGGFDDGSMKSNHEEKLKGEVSLLLTACLIFIQNDWEKSKLSTYSDFSQDPIISTLSSSMAILALRLRCILVYSTQNSMDDSQYNLVKLVVEALDQTRTYFEVHPANFAICVCSSLAAIPDAIFGSPGGARGRLSIDPKHVKTCYSELNDKRQGVEFVKHTFHGLSSLSPSWLGSKETKMKVDFFLLIACERWTKFFTLPLDFIEMTIPLVEGYFDDAHCASVFSIQRVALSYFIRLFEGACMDAEDIHALYLGLSSEQLDATDQDGKTRQSSKSKRRLKERIESSSALVGTDSLLLHAGREAFDRGEVACQSSVLLWATLFKSIDSGLERLQNGDTIDGEGVIGCLIACINACSPHIIAFSSEIKYHSLLQNLIWSTGKICCSPCRYVRSFALDIIINVHSALVYRTIMISDMNDIPDFEKSIALFLCECGLQLAQQCAYPSSYFDDMTEESDEEVEIERNDVRDILRSICDIENPGCKPSIISLLILENILGVCFDRLITTPVEKTETIVHILSSLAKPVNWIATYLLPTGITSSFKTLNLTIASLHKVFGGLLAFFSSSLPHHLVFPVNRLASLAMASFSPTFHGIGIYLNKRTTDNNSFVLYYEMLGLSVSLAAISLHKVPELFGDNCQAIISHLNIKGSMRAPGSYSERSLFLIPNGIVLYRYLVTSLRWRGSRKLYSSHATFI